LLEGLHGGQNPEKNYVTSYHRVTGSSHSGCKGLLIN
jgi:hypothetical protein